MEYRPVMENGAADFLSSNSGEDDLIFSGEVELVGTGGDEEGEQVEGF